MGKPVNKQHRLVIWPEQEAVTLVIEWANINIPGYGAVDRAVQALNACDDVMAETALIQPKRVFKDEHAETQLVRKWLAAAVDRKRGLPEEIVAEINAVLTTLSGYVVPKYRSKGFPNHRLSEQLTSFQPTPLAWAALGVAVVAESGSEWRKRVGRCLYHTDRFVFNEPFSGQRGPLRKFYCGPGCKVMASRKRSSLKVNPNIDSQIEERRNT